jgi:hypothetical protein
MTGSFGGWFSVLVVSNPQDAAKSSNIFLEFRWCLAKGERTASKLLAVRHEGLSTNRRL